MITLFRRLSSAAILSVLLVLASGKPINEEDAASLLPDSPRTRNETVAAIVQDPVVRNAVQSAVGNSSALSGLVVKKSVFVIPVASPDTVLEQKYQIWTAPDAHLEDIRRNITESLRAEAESDDTEVTEIDEIGVSVLIPANTTDVESEESSFATEPEQIRDGDNGDSSSAPSSKNPNESTAAYGKKKNATRTTEFLKANEEKVAIPVALLLESSETVDGGLKIVALLPAPTNESDLRNELDFLKRNREEIKKEIGNRVGPFRSTIEAEEEEDTARRNWTKRTT